MSITISVEGLNVIRSFEGRALRAYKDEVGVWTIGYGNTNYDKGFVKRYGTIKAGMRITAEQAETELLRSLLEGYGPDVGKALPGLRQTAIDAGLSFHYNTGGIGRASWPKYLRAGNMSSARASLMAWNKAGGRVLSGLTRRREREWQIIANSNYGPEGRSGPTDIGGHTRIEALTKLPKLDNNATIDATADAMADSVKNKNPPGVMVAPGDDGEDVTYWQNKLRELGYKITDVPNYAGSTTAAAIRAFQGAHPLLTQDGIIGPATAASIERAIKLKSDKAKAVSGTIIAAGAGTATAVNVASNSSHVWILVVVTAILVAGLGCWAWTKRYDLLSVYNRIRGKVVP